MPTLNAPWEQIKYSEFELVWIWILFVHTEPSSGGTKPVCHMMQHASIAEPKEALGGAHHKVFL